MNNIKRNIVEVRKEIEKYSPYPEKVKLVVVTKYEDLEGTKKYVEAGYKIFGENKAQLMREKVDYFKHENIEWHFIGNLQKNKVKYIIEDVTLIHSVNKLELAQEIDKRAKNINKKVDILLEINIFGEESKQGYRLEKLILDIENLKKLKNLNIIGLMTMAPFTEDEKIKRDIFSKLREIQINLNEKYFDNKLTELSMGMSNDYRIALQEGSTIIRLGTRISKGDDDEYENI